MFSLTPQCVVDPYHLKMLNFGFSDKVVGWLGAEIVTVPFRYDVNIHPNQAYRELVAALRSAAPGIRWMQLDTLLLNAALCTGFYVEDQATGPSLVKIGFTDGHAFSLLSGSHARCTDTVKTLLAAYNALPS